LAQACSALPAAPSSEAHLGWKASRVVARPLILGQGRMPRNKSEEFQSKTNKVLCLSGIALTFVILEIILEAASYALSGTMANGIGRLVMSCVSFLVALAIPCCGWVGAKNRNSNLLCCFGCCNYLDGCADCLLTMLVGLLVLYALGFRSMVNSCELVGEFNTNMSMMEYHANQTLCTPQLHEQLIEACSQINMAVKNATVQMDASGTKHNVNVTQWEVLLSEENCLSSMKTVTTVIIFIGVVMAIFRCCSTCFHCASGYYGMQLKTLVDKGYGTSFSDSESSTESD